MFPGREVCEKILGTSTSRLAIQCTHAQWDGVKVHMMAKLHRVRVNEGRRYTHCGGMSRMTVHLHNKPIYQNLYHQ